MLELFIFIFCFNLITTAVSNIIILYWFLSDQDIKEKIMKKKITKKRING